MKEVNQYLLCSFLLLNCNTKSKDQIAHKTFSKRFIFPDEVTRKMESETVAIVSCLRKRSPRTKPLHGRKEPLPVGAIAEQRQAAYGTSRDLTTLKTPTSFYNV